MWVRTLQQNKNINSGKWLWIFLILKGWGQCVQCYLSITHWVNFLDWHIVFFLNNVHEISKQLCFILSFNESTKALANGFLYKMIEGLIFFIWVNVNSVSPGRKRSPEAEVTIGTQISEKHHVTQGNLIFPGPRDSGDSDVEPWGDRKARPS